MDGGCPFKDILIQEWQRESGGTAPTLVEKESNLCQVGKTWRKSYQIDQNLGIVNQNWSNFNQNRTNLCQKHPISVKLYQNRTNLAKFICTLTDAYV